MSQMSLFTMASIQHMEPLTDSEYDGWHLSAGKRKRDAVGVCLCVCVFMQVCMHVYLLGWL